MQKASCLIVLFFLLFQDALSQELVLKKGMTIKRSATVDSSTYSFSAKKNNPVIVIRGNDLVIDFKGAVLEGNRGIDSPDHYSGLAISIKKGRNITIKNLKVRGYKTAIEAKGIKGLKIENCEFNYSYRRPAQKISSLVELKGVFNFNYHSLLNTAIKIVDCKNIEVLSCSARANENVLMLSKCDGALIANNDFSFNTGAALTLIASTNTQVLYNRFNFNIADTLLGETASVYIDASSHTNTIYKNSISHSANGIMIIGSSEPSKNAPGTGSLIMENDLSYNNFTGIDSRYANPVINRNRIYETRTALSIFSPRDITVSNNQFRFNNTAILINGYGLNTIHHNIFFNDRTAVSMQWISGIGRNARQGLRAIFTGNSFNRNQVVYNLDKVDSIAEFNNLYQLYDTLFKADTSLMNVDVAENDEILVKLSEDLVPRVRQVDSPQNAFRVKGRFAGKSSLLMGRWGPYDHFQPVAVTMGEDSLGRREIMVLGPEGEWSVREISGLEVVSISGKSLPGILVVRKTAGPVLLRLEYQGGRAVDVNGQPLAFPIIFEAIGL